MDGYLLFQARSRLRNNLATPVYKDGKFVGAFGIDIDLQYLFNFIQKQEITPNGYSFIISKAGELIAYPNRKPFLDIIGTKNKFINIHTFHPIPIINMSLNNYLKSGKNNLLASYKYDNKEYIINYETIPELKEYGWLIAVVTPKSDFTGDLEKIIKSL